MGPGMKGVWVNLYKEMTGRREKAVQISICYSLGFENSIEFSLMAVTASGLIISLI